MPSKLIEFKNKANETADTIAIYVKNTLEKCVAFTGDSCSTMFGELRRNEQENTVFAKLKENVKPVIDWGWLFSTRFKHLYPSWG